jgi:membrane fusion protein (multidrug efflux system)
MRSLVIAVLALSAMPGAVSAQAQRQSVLVATMPLHRGKIEESISAYGLVEAAPGAALNLSLPHAGQVLRLRVAAGQMVRQGDPLFDYGADPVVTLDYERARSAVTLAEQERAHTAKLAAQRLATQSQLDQAEKAVRDTEAELDEQRRLGGGEPSRTVAAPFAGVITAVAVANGEHVQANATILQLAESNHLDALLGVEPEDAARIVPGLVVRLRALARPDQPIATAVQSVGGVVDPRTQMVDVVAALGSDGDVRLLSGEHVAGTIAAGEISGWVVPRQAVLADGEGDYVFQVANGKAVRVGVTILGEEGERTAIGGPLDPGRKLVVSGNYQLSDGAAVREAAEQAAQSGAAGTAK